MAPRPEHNDNVIFLLKCIESNGIKIDFNKVGSIMGINANAARMRFSRLRKAVEHGAAEDSTADAVSSPQQSVVSAKRSVRKPIPVKRHKGSPSHNRANGSSVKRDTRGIKIDYSAMLAEDDSLSNHVESEASDFDVVSISTESITESEKPKAPVQVSNNFPYTPPYSDGLIQQEPVLSNTGRAGRMASNGSTSNIAGRAAESVDGTDELQSDDAFVRAEFRDFEDGKKVSNAMFKRRKLNTYAMEPRPLSGSLVRYANTGLSPSMATNASKAYAAVDCASPNESASVGHGRSSQLGVTQGQGAMTWVQRISSFWK